MPQSALMRHLHAVGRDNGLSHDDLRDVFGGRSLKDVPDREIQSWIARHKKPMPPEQRPRAKPGVIRPATKRQINRIFYQLAELAWSAETCKRWLLDRHDITDLAGGAYSTRTASEIITQLDQALGKGPGGRIAREAACST